jgi:uncharacterized metal-binding protein
MGESKAPKPIIYSCSGCSSAAQLANHVALRIDRLLLADMSCIAGVGGDVPSLVRVAKSGKPIIVLDGCPLHCARHSLKRHDVEPNLHFDLSEFDVKKKIHVDFDPDDAVRVLDRVVEAIHENASAQWPRPEAKSNSALPEGASDPALQTKVTVASQDEGRRGSDTL